MNTLIAAHNAVFRQVERADWLLPTVARFLFAAIFLFYFWVSGLTKLGDGIFGLFQPSVGAYAQIFPRAMEAVTYDINQLSMFHWLVVSGRHMGRVSIAPFDRNWIALSLGGTGHDRVCHSAKSDRSLWPRCD